MPSKRPILLIASKSLPKNFGAVKEAIERQFDTTTLLVGRHPTASIALESDLARPVDESDIPAIARNVSAEAVIYLLRLQYMDALEAIPWGGSTVPRLWWEWDSCNNEELLGLTDSAPGAWSRAASRHSIDIVLASGQRATEQLVRRGTHAVWIPKAANLRLFYNRMSASRKGIVHYGRAYASRRLVLAAASRAGGDIDIDQIPHVNYESLPTILNSAQACLICNREVDASAVIDILRHVSPRLGRKACEWVAHWPRSGLIGLGDPVEPMIKNFEAAACGAVPICDWDPDMVELGFVDGQTMACYRELADLKDLLRWILEDPAGVQQVGTAAAELVVQHHGWDHRAAAVDELLRSA